MTASSEVVATSYAAALTSNNPSPASKSPAPRSTQTSPAPENASTTSNRVTTNDPARITRGDRCPRPTTTGTPDMSRQSSPSIGGRSTGRDDDSIIAIVPDEKAGSWNGSQSSSKSTGEIMKPVTAAAPQFVPAIPPVVNVWKKRQEESAKAKGNDLSNSVAPPTASPPEAPKPVANCQDLTSTKKPSVSEERSKNVAIETRERRKVEDGPVRSTRSRRPTVQEEPEVMPPPPVEDATSWPTPDLAQEGFKKEKNVVEREKDKDKTPSTGRGSNKWVPVAIDPPYTRPIPTKGRGRGRGNRDAGRGGAQGSHGSERPERSGGNHTGTSEGDRGRQYNGPGTRGGYQGGRGGKRSSSGGHVSRRESKAGLTNGPSERKREPKEASEWNNESTSSTHDRPPRRGSKDVPKGTDENYAGGESRQHSESERQANGQGYHGERRSSQWSAYGNSRGEPDSAQYVPRERGERERGRGYRGRGGSFHGQYANGSQPGSTFSGPSQFSGQTPGSHSFSHPQRSGGSFRGRSNSTSFPNPQFRFNPAMPPPPFAPPYSPFDYSMMTSQTGPPMNLETLIQQINYYFSVENLCKDIYFRKRMDGDGFVKLSLLLNFNRVQMHTKDINVLRDACSQSQEVQLMPGIDDCYVRKREGWENWVLKEEERDPSARGDMSSWHIDPRQRKPNTTPPGEMSGSAEPFYPGVLPVGQQFYPLLDTAYASAYPTPASALSANVPDFSPSAMPHSNGPEMQQLLVTSHSVDEILDAEVDGLFVVSKRLTASSNTGSPETSPSRRPNGVAEVGTITERLNDAKLTNGDVLQEESPKNPSYHMDSGMTHRLYTEVRAQVQRQRDANGPSRSTDLVTLYKFWSHFLAEKFKGAMYRDFKRFALEDADISLRAGVEELLKFYDLSLKNRDSIGYDLVHDFVSLVRADVRHGESAGLEKLKSVISSPAVKGEFKRSIEALVDNELRNAIQVGIDKVEQRPEPYTAMLVIY